MHVGLLNCSTIIRESEEILFYYILCLDISVIKPLIKMIPVK